MIQINRRGERDSTSTATDAPTSQFFRRVKEIGLSTEVRKALPLRLSERRQTGSFRTINGDSKSDIAVYRSGNWYLLKSSNSGFYGELFGNPNDQPIPSAFR